MVLNKEWKIIIRGIRYFAILLSLCLIFSSGAHAEDDFVAEGQKLAQRLCARCHAIEGTGESPFKKAPPFRSFAEKWPLEALEEALAEGIVVGHSKMPEFKLTPREIGTLITYLKTL